MNLHAPQIIMLILLGISLFNHIYNHGKEHPPYNGPLNLLECIISAALLYWGGFFG